MSDLLFIGILVLCFAVVSWKKLSWGIVLILLLLPVYQIRFHIGPLPSTALEVLLFVLAVAWILRTFRNKTLSHLRWPWRWLVIAVLAAGLIAVFVSPDRWAGLGLFRAYLLEPVVFFYIFVNVMRGYRERRLALFALGASAVIIGFAAMLQYLGLVPGIEPYIGESPRRATALFAFPTAIGKYVGPIVGLFLAFLVVPHPRYTPDAASSRPHWSTWAFPLGVVAFGLLGLLFSVSRGALLGVAAAFLLVSFFSRWRRWLLFGFAAVLVAVLLVPVTREKVTNVFDRKDVSTDVRLVMWKGTLRLLEDRPLFGAGLAGFPLVYPQYKEASHTEFFPNPDQLFLTLWAELGLLGLVVFLVLFFRFGRTCVRLMRSEDQETRQLGLALLAGLVAFLIHGFLDTPYFKNDLAIMFWGLAGLLVVAEDTGQRG